MKDFKTPIVLDTGSGLMKAGFADEDLPNVVFPTIIGMPKYEVCILAVFHTRYRKHSGFAFRQICLYLSRKL